MIISIEVKPLEPLRIPAINIDNGTVFTGVFIDGLSIARIDSVFLKIPGHVVDLRTGQLYGAGTSAAYRSEVINYKSWPESTLIVKD